jgi:hypothetical protein
VKSCLCLRKCACAQTRANGTRHVMSRHLVMRTHHAMSTHQTSQPCRQPHQRPFPCRAPLPEASRHRCRASCCVYVCACVSPRLRHGLLTLHGRAGALCTLHCTQHCMYAYARVVSCIPLIQVSACLCARACMLNATCGFNFPACRVGR